MDSREQFEKWFNERFENLNVEPEIYAEFEKAKSNMKYGFMGCQALNDEKLAKQKEYYEIVMQDGGKRIAELEEKLKVAREALGFYVKYSDVDVASEALDKMKGYVHCCWYFLGAFGLFY